jgi:hypothetical protein
MRIAREQAGLYGGAGVGLGQATNTSAARCGDDNRPKRFIPRLFDEARGLLLGLHLRDAGVEKPAQGADVRVAEIARGHGGEAIPPALDVRGVVSCFVRVGELGEAHELALAVELDELVFEEFVERVDGLIGIEIDLFRDQVNAAGEETRHEPARWRRRVEPEPQIASVYG